MTLQAERLLHLDARISVVPAAIYNALVDVVNALLDDAAELDARVSQLEGAVFGENEPPSWVNVPVENGVL